MCITFLEKWVGRFWGGGLDLAHKLYLVYLTLKYSYLPGQTTVQCIAVFKYTVYVEKTLIVTV